jgi:holdfast attachment protein HfaA
MTRNSKLTAFAIAATVLAFASSAQAGDTAANASSYNEGYGMTPGEENAPINASLRDANGNLTVVNGQFTSSQMSQQTGVQQMSSIAGGMGTMSSSLGGGVGNGATATASAIGNSLNVVTVGSNNTVIVNSTQTNNGNQTATVDNGH